MAASELLQQAVEEAARLLEADGAMIYLLDPADGVLHFAHDAGIANLHSRRWVRRLELRLGQGMFGVAVAERRVVVTTDYPTDDSFEHGQATDRFVDEVGLRSMIVAPLVAGDRAFGGLGTFSRHPNAFTDAQIALVRSLAEHAAQAMANAILIDELARSRHEQERRADAERSLREIATGISSIRETGRIIQRAVDEAARLLNADGARIDLIDPSNGLLRWAYQSGDTRPSDDVWPDDPDETPDQGVSGRAVAEGRPFVTGDYLADDRFIHGIGSDTYIRASGISSVMAAPLVGDDGPFGALTAYSVRRNAWTADDAALLDAVATEAAIAITNSRLLDELATSRGELARRAEAEKALREIAARITAIREPSELLQHVVDEANRLVRADGTILDLLDRETGLLHWSYDSGLDGIFTPAEIADLWLPVGDGATGRAVAEDRVIVAGDDLPSQFPPSAQSDKFFSRTSFRSLIAAPIVGEDGPLGALEVYSMRADAFDDADASLIRALGDQAAIAIQNARLIEDLARSRSELERRADAESTLRQIAANISAIRDSDVVLQQTVDEAKRLLESHDARIDLLENGRLVWKYTSAESRIAALRDLDAEVFDVDQGATGVAITTGKPFRTPDYLVDDRFVHTPESDRFVEASGIRSVIVVPLIGETGVLGAISVATDRPNAYDDSHAELLQAVADQATIAIQNARLIEALERSQIALEKRAETERSLRQMAARIAELREPDELLRQIVEDARRLLGSDGAHLTRMSDEGTHVVPVVVSGNVEEATQTWLKRLRFPLNAGINGLAAGSGEAVWTEDYTVDERIPRDDDDLATADRLGLRGMAAAPLRSPEGRVIGTLAVSYREPHVFDDEEVAILKGLADHAAIALTNTTLYELLRQSESRYRHLVQNSPDVVWSIDAEARFTFISDTCERLTGWHPEELLGRHFGALLHPSSTDVATIDWTADLSTSNQELRGRVNLLHRDGRAIPAEFIAMNTLAADGTFAGANGSVRDMTERDQLERELRESEQRYRFLVENSPDIIFSTDAAGCYTYYSETLSQLTGWRPDDLIGKHFSTVVAMDTFSDAAEAWQAFVDEPNRLQIHRFSLRRHDGTLLPVEVSAIGMTDRDGTFGGIHGAARDVTERESLERDLRRQAAELAAGEERSHLARELHDSVTQALFSMTLLTRTIEMLLDRDLDAARQQLVVLRDLQREALAEMRALIFELRPGNLEQDGLIHALRTHSAALQGRLGLPIVVKGDELSDRLPIEIEEVLYRIAQEALHNVVKHAGAREVRIELAPEGSSVRLRIVDDGRGFDPGAVRDGHLGLTGMRARAEKIGAGFEVRSRTGEGTTIEVVVAADSIAASRGRAARSAAAAPVVDGRAPTATAGGRLT